MNVTAEVTSVGSSARVRAAFVLMVASGFAGLGYQVVWTQQAALWIGHELPAVLAVVTAFFGGLALGALALGGRIAHSARPARWYAGCEAVIAGWSVALAFGMAPASSALLMLTGAEPGALWQGTVAFAGTFVLLLPATAAMGATLPAMERITAGLRAGGHKVAALYACNTLGAMLGVLATAFWLVPEIGLMRTVAVCAALNLLCAAAALRLARRVDGPHDAAPAPAVTGAVIGAGAQPLLWTLAATGMLGIGYEVLVVRVLSQVTEDTVYTFALLLAVYLLGTAIGAALLHRAGAAAAPWRDRLVLLTAATCLLGTASLWGAEALRSTVQSALAPLLGDPMPAALVAEASLALAAFALPTLAMGALFSHLCKAALDAGFGLGRALGVNTLGAAAAPLVFGVLAVPLLGAKFALLVVCTAYLVLLSPAAWRRPAAWATAGALPALALLAPPLAFVDVPEGGRIAHYEEGATAAVSVVEDADGVLRLRINNRQQEGSSATRLADARQALLPLALHPAPRRALFLGLGTGVTASAAAADPALQVDAAELLPEVISASALFSEPGDSAAPQPQPRVIAADARRFVRAAEARYDLIVSDNFHPARSGSGALYTVEHFQAVTARLTADGVFCQWLPLHQMDMETLRSIVRSFVTVNPGALAVLATNSLETPTLGLIARADGGRFDLAALQARLGDGSGPQGFASHGLQDVWAVLGSVVAGPQALARWSAGAPLNTDDRPVVAYRAPRITYAPDSLPRDRLLALLRQLGLTPAELVDAEPTSQQRLAAYWAARDRFLEAGRSVRPLADAAQMLAQVREPLLAVLHMSPDFRPAYDPLLRLAGALARSDPDAARTLLAELQRLQPARAEAGQALAQLDRAPR
jgi:spermidine synthase